MMLSWSTTAVASAMALALACVVQAIALHRSLRRPSRTVAILALNLLFVTCLWLFLWPPQSTQPQAEVVILTASATDADRARARRARHAAALGDVDLSAADQRHVTRLPDLAGVGAVFGNVATLRILGAGVAPDEWPESLPWRVAFDAPEVAPGLRTAHWPHELEPGTALNVTGAVTRTTPADASIHLLDPAGDVIDTVAADERRRFGLTGMTRATGNFVFHLRVDAASGDTLEQVSLPVTVREAPPLRLLLLWSAPSFESRYVMTWARNANASVTARTAISLERYREEFERSPKRSLTTITPDLLASVDAVLIDGRSWSALSTPERAAITQARREDGLGTLLLLRQFADLDDPPSGSPTLRQAASGATSLALDLTATLTRADAALDAAQHPLIQSGSGETLAAYRDDGVGRFGITLIANSHELVTTGKTAVHAKYWKTLIDGIAPGQPTMAINVHPARPRPEKRTQVCFRGATVPASASIQNGDEPARPVSLVTHPLRPGERCGYFWPSSHGWHRVVTGDTVRTLYVYRDEDWHAARDADATTATALAAQGAATPDRQFIATPQAWPRLPFGLAALLLAGGLWWEQKRRS